MRTFLINSALAVATIVSTVPIAPRLASAQGVELRIDRDGPRLRLRDCDPDDGDCFRDRDRDRYRDDDRYGDRGMYDSRSGRGCNPERAVRKAERMGIRRARVVDIDRRTIDVAGRDRRGNRVLVTFGRRDRSCPLLS